LVRVDLGGFVDVLTCPRCGAFHLRVQHFGSAELSFSENTESVITEPTDTCVRLTMDELRATLSRWEADALRLCLTRLSD
jgi:hypothetical protein